MNGRAVVAKTKAYHCFTTDPSTEWHVLCVFPPKYSAHLHMVLTSPYVTPDHSPQRALEGCGSCGQEPTNESDVVVIVIKFVFIVVDSLQGLQIEFVSE